MNIVVFGDDSNIIDKNIFQGLNMKNKLVAVLTIFQLSIFNCSYTSQSTIDINKYENYKIQNSAAVQNLPKLDDLSSYKEVDFQYIEKYELFFKSESILLKIQFDEINYKNQREKDRTNLDFLSEKPRDIFNNISIEEITFSYLNYIFNFLKSSESEYPKKMCLYGYSDLNNTIIYLAFRGEDLDTILSGKDFVKKYFEL